MNYWYVTTTGAGLHNGSIADPWTLDEAVVEYESGVNVLVGDTIWVKANATYTTAGITLTRDGSSLGYIRWAGYTDNIEDLGKATIQRSGGAGVLFSSAGGYYNIFENFIFDGQNSGTDNFASGRYSNTINCESHSAGSDGFVSTYLGGTMINCKAYDNGDSGFNGGGGLYNCFSYNNTDNGFFGIYACWVNCIAYDNEDYGFNGNRILGHFNCTSYGNTLGEVNFQYGGISVNSNLSPLVNKYAFFEATDFVNYEIYNNIDGASVGFDTNGTQFSRNVTTLSADYNAPASLDFTRTSDNLDGIGLSEIGMVSGIDYNISIGVYNPVAVSPDYPAEADVRLGVDYDSANLTGTLDLPAIQDVEYGVQFDGLTKTGTFVVPSENDVEDGVDYGNASEFTGNVTLPTEPEVETGVQYGARGTEFTGGLIINNPSADDVRLGVSYGVVLTGDLDLPAIQDVEYGVQFDGLTKTGLFVSPTEATVETGTLYGYNGEFTGTLTGELVVTTPFNISIEPAELTIDITEAKLKIEVE